MKTTCNLVILIFDEVEVLDFCGPFADMRRQGIGRMLVKAAEQWAATQGCVEMASAAHLENTVSHDYLRISESPEH